MESNIAITQLTSAGLSVAVINWIKNSAYFPWIAKEQTNLLRVVAAVTSAVTAAGIHYTWSPESRQLVFTLPTLAGLWAFGVAWVKSFVVQEITYQATRKKNGNGAKAAAGIPNPGKFAAAQGQKS